MKIAKIFSLLLVFILLSGTRTTAYGRSYDAEKFDVLIEVQGDGSFIVTETVVFRFFGGPYTYAFRELELNELDDVEIMDTAMDGVSLAEGDQPGQAEVQLGDPIIITWHFPETSDRNREFVLRYHVYGNIRQDRGSDLLSWQAIPGEHEYEIRTSTIEVRFPETLEPVESAQIRGIQAVSVKSSGLIVFTAREIPSDTAAIVSMRFPGGSIISKPPAWQSASIQRANQLRSNWPYAAGTGFGLLGLLLGLIGLYKKRFAQQPRLIYPSGIVTSPPDDLKPALAATLTSNSPNSIIIALAAMLDLARRGQLTLVEQDKRGLFKAKDFKIQIRDLSDDLNPHEILLFEFIRSRIKPADDGLMLSSFGQKFSGQVRLFSNILKQELLDAGLLANEHLVHQRRLQFIGTVLLALGLLGLFVCLMVTVNGTILWITPMLFLAAVCSASVIAGMALIITAAKWDIYTTTGTGVRLRWIEFRKYLKELTSREQDLQSDWFEGYLPFALAVGLGERWVKAFKNMGMSTLIPYIMSASGGFADGSVFVAAAATSSSSSSSGGSGGGGGGGSSGAG